MKWMIFPSVAILTARKPSCTQLEIDPQIPQIAGLGTFLLYRQ
jgi:hypothetical protein